MNRKFNEKSCLNAVSSNTISVPAGLQKWRHDGKDIQAMHNVITAEKRRLALAHPEWGAAQIRGHMDVFCKGAWEAYAAITAIVIDEFTPEVSVQSRLNY